MADHPGDENLVVSELHVLPDHVFMLVTPVGRLEQIGLGVHLQHQVDDVGHGDVVRMRPWPGPPAQVVAHAVRRDALQSVI